jgi:transposase
MAPNLADSQHILIRDMIVAGGFNYSQIAEAVECSRDVVKAVSANLQRFGSTTAPRNGGGRCQSILPLMRDALCEDLLRKPDQYLDELVLFLWDEFEVLVSTSTGIIRAGVTRLRYPFDWWPAILHLSRFSNA